MTTVVAMTLKMGEVSVCRLSSDCGRLLGLCFFDLTVKILNLQALSGSVWVFFVFFCG